MRSEQLRGSRHGLTAEERSSRRLNDWLAEKATAPELLLAIQRRAAELSAVHYSTALHRFAKAEDGVQWLSSRAAAQLFQEVTSEVLRS
mmetsp:Transcript_7741/g.17848  ORF Transcript_7741/g.17848 Transcript_7741/m.17848 type:complete len:89 (+) Transcript_7741:55-321(+)